MSPRTPFKQSVSRHSQFMPHLHDVSSFPEITLIKIKKPPKNYRSLVSIFTGTSAFILLLIKFWEDVTAVLRLLSYWDQVGIAWPTQSLGVEVRSRGRRVHVERRRAWAWLEAEITLVSGDAKTEQSRQQECELEGVRAGAGVWTNLTPHGPSQALTALLLTSSSAGIFLGPALLPSSSSPEPHLLLILRPLGSGRPSGLSHQRRSAPLLQSEPHTHAASSPPGREMDAIHNETGKATETGRNNNNSVLLFFCARPLANYLHIVSYLIFTTHFKVGIDFLMFRNAFIWPN